MIKVKIKLKRERSTWLGGPYPVNHKRKTQQFNTKVVIKENTPKETLPRTIQRTQIGAQNQVANKRRVNILSI